MNKRIVLFLFLLGISPFISSEQLSFVSIEKLIEQEVGRIVLPRLYEKIGIEITIRPMPGKRAQYEATKGKALGEIMRIWTYGDENPTVIRVPTPYYFLETMAFVRRDSGIDIDDPSQLEGYRIIRVRGVKHSNNITEGLENVLDVENTLLMMQMLQLNRADIALTNRRDGLEVIRKAGLNDIVPSGTVLATWELYHYIREERSDLIPRIDRIIREMRETGELDRLISEAEETVLNRS